MDAMRLWKGIPTEKIPEAVDMALVAAGNFPATNGGVAKAWEFRRGKETLSDFAALGDRDRKDEKRFLAAPDARPATEEEKAANREELRRIQQLLGPGTRPDGWGA